MIDRAGLQRRRPRRANPETSLVRACLQILALHKIPAWRQNSGRLITAHGQMIRLGRTGAADITGILPDGRRLEIEVKRPGSALRPAQVEFLAMIRDHGGVALVVRSAAQLDEALRELGQRVLNGSTWKHI